MRQQAERVQKPVHQCFPEVWPREECQEVLGLPPSNLFHQKLFEANLAYGGNLVFGFLNLWIPKLIISTASAKGGQCGDVTPSKKYKLYYNRALAQPYFVSCHFGLGYPCLSLNFLTLSYWRLGPTPDQFYPEFCEVPGHWDFKKILLNSPNVKVKLRATTLSLRLWKESIKKYTWPQI